MNSNSSIQSLIVKALATGRHKTVGELARQIVGEDGLSEDEFIQTVKSLAYEGLITLEHPDYQVSTFLDYLFTVTLSGWLWASIALTLFSLIAIVATPDVFPLNVSRWFLGSLFVLFLPGYGLLQLLFPKSAELDRAERFALDVGLSLAVVPLVGLVLNFSPWGLRFVPIVASLTVFTGSALVSAGFREYLELRRQPS